MWTNRVHTKQSEFESQHKLDAARGARPGGAGVNDVGDLAKFRRGHTAAEGAQAGRRIAVHGMVEQVKSRGPEIKGEPLRQLEGLRERTVNLVVPGATSDESAQIAPSPFRRNRERRRVEPVVNGLMRRVERHTRNEVRSLARGVPVRQVRRL